MQGVVPPDFISLHVAKAQFFQAHGIDGGGRLKYHLTTGGIVAYHFNDSLMAIPSVYWTGHKGEATFRDCEAYTVEQWDSRRGRWLVIESTVLFRESEINELAPMDWLNEGSHPPRQQAEVPPVQATRGEILKYAYLKVFPNKNHGAHGRELAFDMVWKQAEADGVSIARPSIKSFDRMINKLNENGHK